MADTHALLTADLLSAMQERYLQTRGEPLTKQQADEAWVDRLALLNHLDALAGEFERRADVARVAGRNRAIRASRVLARSRPNHTGEHQWLTR